MESYYAAVRRFLRIKLRGSDWADDLAQETFARALASGGSLDATRAGTRQAWLFQIAANLAVDFGRRERTRAAVIDHNASAETIVQEQHEDPDERRQNVARLIAVIDTLSPKRRDVLILHKLEGYSHAEIAERLGMSRGAVEKNIVRALADLRDRLTEVKR